MKNPLELLILDGFFNYTVNIINLEDKLKNLLKIYLLSPLVLFAAELDVINEMPFPLNIILQKPDLDASDASNLCERFITLSKVDAKREKKYHNVDSVLFNLNFWDPSGYDDEKYSLLFRISNPTKIVLYPVDKETYVVTPETVKKEVTFPASLKFINLQPLVYFYNEVSTPVRVLYRIKRKSGIETINKLVSPRLSIPIDIDDSNNIEGFAVYTQDGKTVVYHDIPLSGKTYKVVLGDYFSYEPAEIARTYYAN